MFSSCFRSFLPRLRPHRRTRITTFSTVAAALLLGAGSAAAQSVVVGPIEFDEPEFSDAFTTGSTITSLDGEPIPAISFHHNAGFGTVGGLDEVFQEIDSSLEDPVLVVPQLDDLRLEFGGEASAIAFDFGLVAVPVDLNFAPHGVQVRLFDASGNQVGSAVGSLPAFDGTTFGGSFQANSSTTFRAVEISSFFGGPAQLVTLYLDKLAVTLVPDEELPAELGPEEVVSDAGTLPVIATDPAGRRAVAWEETAGGSREVFARLFDADGTPLGQRFRVNERSSADDQAPSIAFDADGELVVAWLRESGNAASVLAAGSILGRRFDPTNGAPLGGEVVIAPSEGQAPAVSSSAGGDAVVTWSRGDRVLGRRIDRTGAPQGGTFDVASSLGTATARVASSAAGDFVVVWAEPDGAGGSAQGAAASTATGTILGRFFDASGLPKGNAFPISEAGVAATAPAIASDATGNVVVVWQQSGAGGSDVLGRRLSRNGDPRGGAFRLHDDAAGAQTAPSVAVNAAGDIVVAWESTTGGGGGASSAAGSSILGRLFDGSSLAPSEEIEIAAPTAGAAPAAPQVTIDDGDDATVVYQRKTAGGAEAGLFSRKLKAALPPVACAPNGTTLCLADGRFEVRVAWRDFEGNTGIANVEPLSGDTGYFWFFDPSNVEIVLKVLDARAINGFFWVFYGALSNVEYTISVHDTETGVGRTYFNPAERFASAGDSGAISGSAIVPWPERGFAPASAAPEPSDARRLDAPAVQTCVADAETLCLQQTRFAIDITFRDFEGQTGVGKAESLSSDTGFFWFFDPANVEVVVKVLDARAINGFFWVFYGALTNVEFELTVTDTVTGTKYVYRNPSGVFASVGDTKAVPGG